jgi:hypothetical protein
VARYEVGLQTRLRFSPLTGDKPFDTTVSTEIAFGGRTFYWHDPDDRHDPTLSVVHDDSLDERQKVELLAERLVSAIAYHEEIAIATTGGLGIGGNQRPVLPAVRPMRSDDMTWLTLPINQVNVANDAELRRSLAFFREGLCAASPFYRFLAFWGALEIAKGGEEGRNKWIAVRAGSVWGRRSDETPLPSDVVRYFADESRHAIAHTVRYSVALPRVDPDLPGDRARLSGDSRVLQELAHLAIRSTWPHGVQCGALA